MQIKNDYLEAVFQKYSHVVLFGAGAVTGSMFAAYKDYGFERKIDYIIDNDKGKDGKSLNVNGKEIELVSIESFQKLKYKDYALIIMPVFFLDIVRQIDGNTYFNNVPSYVYAFMMNMKRKKDFSLKTTDNMKIPKRIHYCWFGGKELPDIYKKNIDNWRQYCPDYEIIEWNESNYDIRKNQFTWEAYQTKNWAFVPDYIRKDVIYEYGGIYLDVDVEILRPPDDLLYNDFFMCRDDIANINMGSGFGAAKGNEVIKALRDYYDNCRFVDDNGLIIGRACGNYETPAMIAMGYQPDNECQTIGGGKVFPREVLCPISWMGLPDVHTDKTVTVHKFDDFLVDKEGRENAPKLRREIETLLERAARIRKDNVFHGEINHERKGYRPALRSEPAGYALYRAVPGGLL